MAKHKTRRGDHALVGLKLGSFNPLNRGVNSTDVLAGAIAGIVGGGALKYAARTYAPNVVPAQVENFLPLIAAVGAGALLKLAQAKTPIRGSGHFVGAVAAGIAMQTYNILKDKIPALADVVSLPVYGGYNNYGLLVNDQSNPFGLLVQDNTQQTLNELSAISAATDDDGMNDLIG